MALEENDTWTLVPLPSGKHVIGCKWVYKIKHNSNGSIERYKARLVVKGFNQKERIEYTDRFSPAAKMVTVHTHQMDVFNTFLQGDFKDEIFMQIPQGFRKQGESILVCRLRKSIYGLKQKSRQWNVKITETLIKNSYKQSLYDSSLFTNIKHKALRLLHY